jgi:hypothetical protein
MFLVLRELSQEENKMRYAFGLSDGAISTTEDQDRGPALLQRCHTSNINKNKLRGLSPRANYTDLATAACRRS